MGPIYEGLIKQAPVLLAFQILYVQLLCNDKKCFFFSANVCLSIRLLEVTIPPHAIRGQNAKLNCNYDMEGDKLYSIKWYRNGHEFYRFIPSDEPKTTVFNGDGINVDVSIDSQLCFGVKGFISAYNKNTLLKYYLI